MLPINAKKLFVLSGPSGAGKTTILERLLRSKEAPPLHHVLTYTTRTPRNTEVDGRDYFFIAPEIFNKLRSEGFFAESNFYNNAWYGSPGDPQSQIPDGMHGIMIIDRNGIAALIRRAVPMISMWIAPSSADILVNRLRVRHKEDSTYTEKRCALAREEFAQEQQTPLCSYQIINDDLEVAIKKINEIMRREIAR